MKTNAAVLTEDEEDLNISEHRELSDRAIGCTSTSLMSSTEGAKEYGSTKESVLDRINDSQQCNEPFTT